ncbi:MAG: hypothetical protein IJT60_08810 [Clostridia bacterium]|nr:hypothetical protein [Clostridia bacterium]
MFYIKVAGMTIGIDATFPYIRTLCEPYLIPEETVPLFTVDATESERACMTRSVTWKQISPGEAESMVIMRKIALQLPCYDGFLFHASVVQCRNMAIAFSAPRGTGKTTHALLWVDTFKNEARIVNGDKPLIRVENKLVTAYGTPWSGKEGYNENFGVSLTAICFLEQGQQVSIRKIESEEYIRRLLPQTYFSTDQESLDKCGKLFARLCTLVPAYVLSATISQEAVRKAYDEISKG